MRNNNTMHYKLFAERSKLEDFLKDLLIIQLLAARNQIGPSFSILQIDKDWKKKKHAKIYPSCFSA